jgi:hypothetical protein
MSYIKKMGPNQAGSGPCFGILASSTHQAATR